MTKGLKVAMIVYGALHILMGLMFIFVREQMGTIMGYEKGPEYIHYFMTMLGVSFIVPGAFIIVAATRDILKNILWVQLAIAWSFLVVVVAAYSMMRGFITFSQEGTALIINAVFAIALLALYPWRVKPSGK